MKRLLYVIYTVLMFGWIVGCHRSSNRTENLEDSTVYDVGDTSFSDSVCKDSFTVIYRQPVNGYKVKAVVKFEQGCYFYPTEDGMLVADITFEKNGHSFIVHTDSYGDTCFSAGMRGSKDGRNIAILRKYHGKNINADFPALTSSSTPLPMDVPFFFKDFDFDGKDELIVVHYGCAIRNHDEYDIYRIVDGNPMLLDSPPFR